MDRCLLGGVPPPNDPGCRKNKHMQTNANKMHVDMQRKECIYAMQKIQGSLKEKKSLFHSISLHAIIKQATT